ncbi:MAG: DNA polymerase IV [Clostridia bacterium]|nr:DNA polymerase IV [Clostridia bacterium]
MNDINDILLCDLDAFFASVEQLDHPELQGKPVIVGGSPESRGVVSTCSYEARQYGVHSAMPMKKALTLCPQAVVLRGNMSRYKTVSLQVRQIFERFTPAIEFVSIDEAYLAVKRGTGCHTGNAIHIAVKEELRLPISVGVSTNKLLAKIACELAKPNKVGSLWLEEVPQLLWPHPVRILPGIGPVTEKNLEQHGIKTVKDLAAYPAASLEQLLGNNAKTLQNYANGIDNRQLELEHEAKSISEETTFPEDIYDREIIFTVLLELSAGVGYRLRTAGVPGRTITLKLRFSDFRTISRSKTLPDTVSGDMEIYRIVKELFTAHSEKPPWRLLGVQVSGFEQGSQLSLLPTTLAEKKEKHLLQTKDLLRKKYGSEVLFPAKRLSRKNKED